MSPRHISEEVLSTTAVPYERSTGVPRSTPVESSAPASPPRTLDWRLVLLVVLAASAAYVAWHLSRGWMPHDEGALAQSAERLLRGELPHRDFDEIYTGGLSFLNAGAFRLLGTTLLSMRVVLFAVFLTWVPVVYYLASRFVAPLAAGGVTLLAVVWSLPNYSAPMPSWYNLFLATFGVAALFRHMERRRRRWLVVAGLAGGLSFLVKVIGLYYVAGVLLYFVFQSHALARAEAGPTPRRGNLFAAFASLALLLFVATVAALVRYQLYAPEVVHFVMPSLIIAALLARNEWTLPAGHDRARFMTLGGLVIPFLVGVALPVALFLVPYARSGALPAFFSGVFILPTKRFGIATVRALPLSTMLALVPLAILATGARELRARLRPWHVVVLGLLLTVILLLSGGVGAVYRAVWYSTRNLIPALALAGVLTLDRERHADAGSPLLRSRLMLLLSVTALCSLVQFPFVIPIYFCYVAPLVALTAVALFCYLRPVAPAIPVSLLVFYIAFAVVRINTSSLYAMGGKYLSYRRTSPLALERGGLEVPDFQAAEYRELVPLLRKHARGEYIWASPDAPEVYFLTGRRNPTRSLFEFFDDPNDRTERILRTLDARGVTVIALNQLLQFSPPIREDLYARLVERYPYGKMVGRFEVRWKP